MDARLSVDETRISFEGIRKQIKDIEASIMAVYHNGSGPLATDKEIGVSCALSVESLKTARSQIEKIVCGYDSTGGK